MDDTQSWGQYAPPLSSWPLRALIAIGLARGAIKKKIQRIWKKRFGQIVDITACGIKYRLNIEDNVTDRRILTSCKRYDHHEIDALKAICSNGTFIDIGANIGFYSLSIAAHGARVFAIEPNPKTLSRLRYNVRLNDLSSKIIILPIGIGVEGTFQLVSSGDLGSANIRPNSSGYTEAVDITTRPLYEVLNEQGVRKIDGLKIDIEGMEDHALLPFFKAAPKSMWPRCIVIEHCNRDHWENDILSHLLDNGYTLTFKTRGNSILQRD